MLFLCEINSKRQPIIPRSTNRQISTATLLHRSNFDHSMGKRSHGILQGCCSDIEAVVVARTVTDFSCAAIACCEGHRTAGEKGVAQEKDT